MSAKGHISKAGTCHQWGFNIDLLLLVLCVVAYTTVCCPIKCKCDLYKSKSLGIMDEVQLKMTSAGDLLWEVEAKIVNYYFERRRNGFEGSWSSQFFLLLTVWLIL